MEHDYQNARRGAVLNAKGKTRITMYLDDDLLTHFRQAALAKGRGYQTEINATLRDSMEAQTSGSRVESNFVSISTRSVRNRVVAVAKRRSSYRRENSIIAKSAAVAMSSFVGGRA